MTRAISAEARPSNGSEDMESCAFPPLHNSRVKGSQWASISAHRSVGSHIVHLSRESRQETHIVLAALWSVILRRYIESCITQIWLSMLLSQHDCKRVSPQVMSIDLVEQTPFNELLKTKSWNTTIPRNGSQPNTGIIVVGDGYPQAKDDQLLHDNLHHLSERCDILLVLHHSQDGVRVVLSYQESTILNVHAASVLEQLELLTQSVDRDVAQTVNGLWSIGDRDTRQLQRWNSRRSTQATDRFMHEIIHQRALETPSKLAVEAWDGTLTYHQLEFLTSQLASCLARHGIGENDFVPISFQKSLWAIVAMLAVNKSGAAFVPVDPSIPTERLVSIIRQTEARLVLACNERSKLVQELGIPTIIVPEQINLESNDRPRKQPRLRSQTAPAYSLFTSGSTGEPKGCVVGQDAFASIASHCVPLYLRPDSRVLQFASIGFGMSVIEIFCTLSCGGTLCIPSDTARMNSLAQAITSMTVDWTVMSPTTLSTLSPEDVVSLRTIVLGGEPVLESHISDWASKVRLIQIYGLTECSGVFTVSNPIVSSDLAERSIGFPVDGRCWIVDAQDHRRLRPIGAVGELLIDTPNLAQGYLRDSERTMLNFVPPPEWMEKQEPVRRRRPAVVYKTGDLARFNPDGSICHLGRKDHQLKVRGQRVEAGELEHHLQQLFSDVEAVVVDIVTPTGSNGVPSLAAFILQPSESRDVPIFAKPTPGLLAGVQSAKLTLSKKDRRRLRQEVSQLTWDQLRSYTSVENGSKAIGTFESGSEQVIAQIWAELLQIDPDNLGRYDDLLALGGDSIMAMRVVAMARVKGLGLTVSDIFTSPKLADMAKAARPLPSAAISSRQPVDLVNDDVREVCISRIRKQTTLLQNCSDIPLVLPATGIQKFFIERSSFDYFCYIFEGDLDFSRIQQACTAVVKKHDILRTVFTQNGHDVFQLVVRIIKTPLYHITTASDVSRVSEKICSSGSTDTLPMDCLAARFILVSNNGAQQHAFILRLSHAQYDGFSLPILTDDLAVAYDGSSLSSGSQFLDYIRYRSQQDLTPGYDFWRKYLAGCTMTGMWQHSSARVSQDQQSVQHQEVNSKIIIPFLSEPPNGITMATLVKAAGALVLGRLTHASDIVLGQTVNGRSGLSMSGIETILGPCLNFLPIRISIARHWKVGDFLAHVQDQHIQTTAYDYMEFTDIVEKSTSWPSDTKLGAIFHHQSIDTELKISLGGMKNTGSALYMTGSYLRQQLRSETWVYSMPVGEKLEICIRTPSHIMSAEHADGLLHRMAVALHALANSPNTPLADVMSD
ncbi:hypothetical protein FE257_002677 [Aspergillus nanangensis]|uniref:Carrier domain-containing protein n=1 Tax=Aspergillus nanangensis TaxID=2582783 RepID=A0AAD4CCR6_ASPNN|nr:hypothetical protein FE257_002677 [Aspergillus nanangensis]